MPCTISTCATAKSLSWSPFNLLGLKVQVYDVTSRKTFDDIVALRDEIFRTKGTEDVPIVLVGNKCDLKVGLEAMVLIPGRAGR